VLLKIPRVELVPLFFFALRNRPDVAGWQSAWHRYPETSDCSQIIFGSPQLRRPKGNSFCVGGFCKKLPSLMALLKQVEDDGLQRLLQS